MKCQPMTSPGTAALAIMILSVTILAAGETNNSPASASVRGLRIPDFDDKTVKGVRVAPGGA
jgi:hypothetical protein